MNTYFTKFFTVNSTLEEHYGNWVYDSKSKGYNIFAHDYRAIMTKEEMEEFLQPVVLFLCTNDIHIGDKISMIHGSGNYETTYLRDSEHPKEPHDIVTGNHPTDKNFAIKRFWCKKIVALPSDCFVGEKELSDYEVQGLLKTINENR